MQVEILKLGSQGAAVKALQNSLLLLNYQLAVDGFFGPTTEHALIEFQNANHLTPDGVFGPNTNAILKVPNQTAPVVGVTGIDISHLNNGIDWNRLKADVSFVYCKASQGATFKDAMLGTYLDKLAEAKIIRGAYHFLEFQNATADEQIANFLSCGIDFSEAGMLPPVLDIEWQVPDALNPYVLTNRPACVQLISDWLSNVATKTGRTPIIYTNRVYWHDYLGNPTGFEQYPLWIAAYQTMPPGLPPGWSGYTFWQYSGTGRINSISEPVDTDIFNGSLDQLKSLAQL